VPLIEGSTRAIASTVTHAGIARGKRYAFDMPSSAPMVGARLRSQQRASIVRSIINSQGLPEVSVVLRGLSIQSWHVLCFTMTVGGFIVRRLSQCGAATILR
jgi:hypothetical protein